MSLRILIAAVASAAALVGASTPLLGQSLGEVARKEEERRQTVKKPAKVYTNKDLGSVDPGPPVPAPDTSKPLPGSADPKAAEKDKEKGPVKDQAYWGTQVKTLQAQVDRDQLAADAMQGRISSLTADFAARDDPAQRALINSNRQKAVAELERLNLDVKKGKKALADLLEEARRAGVPPGWLR
jgi:hypothetical protein